MDKTEQKIEENLPHNPYRRIGTRVYHNLAPRGLDIRNERFRLIAFQNIQEILNRASINIFLGRRKLMGSRKNPKLSESDLRRWYAAQHFKVKNGVS